MTWGPALVFGALISATDPVAVIALFKDVGAPKRLTVLVEGDDHNEPISDAVRGIIDGHIILDRAIAERGRFPAINILRSISRAMPKCNSEAENHLVMRAKTLMATYEDMGEMIRLGAYRAGSDPAVDEAIQYHEALETCIAQDKDERRTLADSYAMLAECLGEPPP